MARTALAVGLGALLSSPAAAFVDGGPLGQVFSTNRFLPDAIDAPVSDCDGVRLSGPDFMAQLYAGPPDASLDAMGVATRFRTDAGAGYFVASTVTLSNVNGGDRADLQIRAWASDGGARYEEAVARGGRAGGSNVLSLVVGGGGSPPSFPTNLIGLNSFSLQDLASPDGGCMNGSAAGGGSATGGGDATGEGGGGTRPKAAAGCGCSSQPVGTLAVLALGLALLRARARRREVG